MDNSISLAKARSLRLQKVVFYYRNLNKIPEDARASAREDFCRKGFLDGQSYLVKTITHNSLRSVLFGMDVDGRYQVAPHFMFGLR
jgi:hypothetical protein